MTFDQLIYLTAIAKDGTISSVAKQYNISHSAISRAISNLESELGITLFKRTRTGSAITMEGKVAAEIAEKLLGYYTELLELRNDTALVKNLRIGVSFIDAPLIADVISRFSENYPGITIHMIAAEAGNLMDLLKKGEADFGFSFFLDSALDQIKKEFKVKKLLHSELAVFFAPDSPLEGKKIISPDEVKNQHFVLWSDPLIFSVLNDLFDLESSGNSFTFINHNETMLRLVKQKNCIGTGSVAFVQKMTMIEDGSLHYAPVRKNDMPVDMSYCCIYPKNYQINSAIKVFTELFFKAVIETYQRREESGA